MTDLRISEKSDFTHFIKSCGEDLTDKSAIGATKKRKDVIPVPDKGRQSLKILGNERY